MSNNFRSPRSKLCLSHADNNPLRNSRVGRRQLLKGVAALGLAGISLMSSPFIDRLINAPSKGTALADASFQYYGEAAAAWADQYAISGDSNYSQNTQGGDLEPPWWEPWNNGDDCTNFVSNAMYQGGFPMDDQWFSYIDSNGNWQYGVSGFHPWTYAPDLYAYLMTTQYGQLLTPLLVGPQRESNPTNGLVPGDLLFFSWKNDGNLNHMAIQSTGGVDSNGYPYDQVDTHTSDHLQIFWTLEDFWSGDSGDIPDPNNVAMYRVHIVPNVATSLYIPTY